LGKKWEQVINEIKEGKSSSKIISDEMGSSISKIVEFQENMVNFINQKGNSWGVAALITSFWSDLPAHG
jgi:DNA topoisomerase IA